MHMPTRRGVLAAALLAASATFPAFAETFPARPVRIVVNSAPGGSLDITTRLVAQKMGEKLGQNVVVENRAGADGLVGIRAVLGTKADGYTLLSTAGTIAIQPAVKREPGYDLLKDFQGVGMLLRMPSLLLVGAGEPDRTLPEFIARAKANPDQVAYASAGVGTTTHIASAEFAQQAGVKLQHIPYKGSGAAFSDVAGGRVPMIITGYSSALPFLQSGKMRPLGVTSTARLPVLPQVPTIAEQGLPDYQYSTWFGLLAPAGTPDAIVQALSEALRGALTDKALADRFRHDGSDPSPMGAGEFQAFLRKELDRMQQLVTSLGLAKE